MSFMDLSNDPAQIMKEECSNTVYIVIIVIMAVVVLGLIAGLIAVSVMGGDETKPTSEENKVVVTTEEKKIVTAEGEEIPATGGLLAGSVPKAGQAKGGWLKVQKIRFEPPQNGTYFHVPELEIYSNGVNIAKKGTTTRTGEFLNGDAVNAIDGKIKPHAVSMNVKDGFYFEIDLKEEVPVDGIVYYADGSGARSVSTQVFLIDSAGNKTTAGVLNSEDRQVLEP